jgi:hypothetical protein
LAGRQAALAEQSRALRVLTGFGIGTVVAVTLGVLVARSKAFENILKPILNLVGPIPPFAFLADVHHLVGHWQKFENDADRVCEAAAYILAYSIDGGRCRTFLLACGSVWRCRSQRWSWRRAWGLTTGWGI